MKELRPKKLKGLLKYTSTDYESIMEEFWDIVPTLTELWKPEADSDPGVVLGKFLASVANMLGVNLTMLANEIFGPSVTQRKNAEKLFSLMGYKLGWYTAGRTEVTFINTGIDEMIIEFGFNGSNFCTLNAYSDITDQPRVITYNILPLTNRFGAPESRSRHESVSANINIFSETDRVVLKPQEMVTRVAIEGELRSFSVSVKSIKENNYIINLPSQHIDTTAVWVKARPSGSNNKMDTSQYLATQWIQVQSPGDFVIPEPRFAVTYDNYSNAQIIVSNYLNELDNYDTNWLTVYWMDCSGMIGSVGENVLTNFLPAWPSKCKYDPDYLSISNMSNTNELPHTNTITGKSPETAKEAYYNSRNYINTWDSLVTLPDFNRFLNREPGVDTGLVIDCQKALEINLAIFHDQNLTAVQKAKMYIGPGDIPKLDSPIFDWGEILQLGFDPEDPLKYLFQAGFKQYHAFCFGIHNDFQNSNFGVNVFNHVIVRGNTVDIPNDYHIALNKNKLSADNQYITAQGIRWNANEVQMGYTMGPTTNFVRRATTNVTMHSKGSQFIQYRMPPMFEQMILRDYQPLQAMTVKLQFCFSRIFPWYVVGTIYPKNPVSPDVGKNIIDKVKEDLAIFFSPANRRYGIKPTTMEVVDVIRNADDRIDYFDAGSPNVDIINWRDCDIEYFNPISFARYMDIGDTTRNIIISPEFLLY